MSFPVSGLYTCVGKRAELGVLQGHSATGRKWINWEVGVVSLLMRTCHLTCVRRWDEAPAYLISRMARLWVTTCNQLAIAWPKEDGSDTGVRRWWPGPDICQQLPLPQPSSPIWIKKKMKRNRERWRGRNDEADTPKCWLAWRPWWSASSSAAMLNDSGRAARRQWTGEVPEEIGLCRSEVEFVPTQAWQVKARLGPSPTD